MMTNLEITTLCAQAIGAPLMGSNVEFYDPLHDDSQLLALARKFPFEFEQCVIEWCNHLRRGDTFSLNYCFCGRIANGI